MAIEDRTDGRNTGLDSPPRAGPSASSTAPAPASPSRLEGHAALIGSLAWPLVFLILLAVLADPLRSFLGGLGSLNLEAHGVKLNAERTKQQVAFAISGAYDRKQVREGTAAPVGAPASIEKTVEKVASPQSAQRLKGALILWVDDHPSNNVLERQAMEALGVRFTNVTSNTVAQDVLNFSRYDVVISDLSRDGDGCDKLTAPADCERCAALRLLEWMKSKALVQQTDIIFYTSQDKATLCKPLILGKGAFGVSGEPGDLLDLVTHAVR